MLRRQRPRCFYCPRPLEAPGLQPLVCQHKAVLLPVQRLHPVPAPAVEQKQRIRERIELELLLYQSRKTVYPFAQVCIPYCEEYTLGRREVLKQHSMPELPLLLMLHHTHCKPLCWRSTASRSLLGMAPQMRALISTNSGPCIALYTLRYQL